MIHSGRRATARQVAHNRMEWRPGFHDPAGVTRGPTRSACLLRRPVAPRRHRVRGGLFRLLSRMVGTPRRRGGGGLDSRPAESRACST